MNSAMTEAQTAALEKLVEAVDKWGRGESHRDNTPEEDAIIDALHSYYRTTQQLVS